jgi:Cu(I)/Ag(I) efflux system membrane protein CusA/SilA
LLLTGFLIIGGIYSASQLPIDAIPDLSDVQVVLRTEFPGQAPQIMEDQVTYPLTTAMLAVPQAKIVRGYSMFGSSFVYIIFEDGTDMYWARSRVLEQLNFVSGELPPGVTPQLGPDATGVGWVFEYVLVTGRYCPDHPDGVWNDPGTGTWKSTRDEFPEESAVQKRLQYTRVFRQERLGMGELPTRCPVDGKELLESDQDLSDLRKLQDWYLRYEMTAVTGVSEVPALGGFVRQYQVVVDPVKLRAYGIPLAKVRTAIKRSNADVGGRLIEMSETEYMVRGVGYLGTLNEKDLEDAAAAGTSISRMRANKVLEQLRKVSLGAAKDGTPLYLSSLAEVRIGPDIRRGIAEWKGEGEVVAGVVVMRFGENARDLIERARTRLKELEHGLPPGVAVEIAYDRSDLIERAVETLKGTLIEEISIVTLVCIFFLMHIRSALVAAFVLPVGVLATLSLMYLFGINANIMSLGGIAISIGVMVDSSIIMVENAHKHVELEKLKEEAGEPRRPWDEVIADGAAEVGPSLFFALLIIVVSFLPIFVLGEQSGRLFKPLAFTKTFAMGAGAVLAVTIIPVLMVYFVTERVLPESYSRAKQFGVFGLLGILPAAALWAIPMGGFGPHRMSLGLGWIAFIAVLLMPQKVPPEHNNPVSRVLEAVYNPFFAGALRFHWILLLAAAVAVAITTFPFGQLGSEFMPPLEEGDLLYMPTLDPGISMTKVRELLQQTDKLISQFPEVESVFGKAGRAGSATDPAPPNMFETTIVLHRDPKKWRHVPVSRFFDGWPTFLRSPLGKIFHPTRPIKVDELIYGYKLPRPGKESKRIPGLNDVVQVPGMTNAWTMPIKTRIDMLSTGIKTPVGIKVMGPNLKVLSRITKKISQVVKTAPTISKFTTSAFPEKAAGGNYLDIQINRDEIARYGLAIADVQAVIMTATGGMNLTSTIEGRERYPVNLRYPSELRNNLPRLRETLVATSSGAQIPLGQLAQFRLHKGPPMVKSENARLTSWVFVDIAKIDVGTYVHEAQKVVAEQVKLPAGYSIIWSGQFEYMEAARKRLLVAVPLTLVMIVLLLYMSTRSWLRVGIVLLAIPFSLVGAVWLLYLMGYHLSLAVWVGVIALAGLDAETGVVMLLYLDTSFERFRAEGRMRDLNDLWHAVHDGAVKRIRPKTMTVMAIFMGLLPLLWAEGAGADTMRRLAVPMIGGVTTSFLMELLIYPILFYIAKEREVLRGSHD